MEQKLTNDELIKRSKAGDEEAKSLFVKQNTPLVYSIINDFLPKNMQDDLFQIGCVGLMKALNNLILLIRYSFLLMQYRLSWEKLSDTFEMMEACEYHVL